MDVTGKVQAWKQTHLTQTPQSFACSKGDGASAAKQGTLPAPVHNRTQHSPAPPLP